MMQFILPKQLNLSSFEKYIASAQESNHFTNYGEAVQALEARARKMLKIDESKSVIAVVNGATALNVIIHAFERKDVKPLRTLTQDFTFPSAAQGSAEGSLVCDLNSDFNIDLVDFEYAYAVDIIIVTNIFGHLQDINFLVEFAKQHNKYLVFDNAATPYSFYEGKNSCNFGNASFVSLHHTKPLGFGEGGLVIIDSEYEEEARAAVNFGWDKDKNFNERGGNCKMSEISAASILQWWDQFDIDDLAEKYRNNYYNKRYELANAKGKFYKHHGNDFFPSCLPFIYENPIFLPEDAMKYYKPLVGLPNSKYIYDRIVCYGLAEDWYVQ